MFEPLCSLLGDTNLHIVMKDEHVPTIERSIRTVKERGRCFTASLPYKCYLIVLKRGLVYGNTEWLYTFPNKEVISEDQSPNVIVEGNHKANCNSLRVTFRAYTEVYTNTKNTNLPRTVGVIVLRSSNVHSGY